MSFVDTFSPFPSSTAHTLYPSVRGLRLGQRSPALWKRQRQRGHGVPPGPGARGRQSGGGAGTWFACKTQQELFGQLVLVGRAESLWRLSSQHGGMFSCTGVPRS